MKLTLEFAEDGDAIWKNPRGEFLARWNSNANIDYPEELTADRDIGVLVAEVYEKGYQDGRSEGNPRKYEPSFRQIVEIPDHEMLKTLVRENLRLLDECVRLSNALEAITEMGHEDCEMCASHARDARAALEGK